ncbi:hypothetical protein RNZ50_13185 [Paracoccaceae bacterium Fryx2]|nr:hypothetical protein [Paracoccaceae bacterium Fryx2]
MSAPNTNLDKQKRRHRGPLIGMAAVVLFGVGIIAYWLTEESADGQSPADAPAAHTDPETQPDPATQTAPAQQPGDAPARPSP